MAAMPYLIDGHNLIPKLGLRLDSPDDETQLVAIIQEFARLSRHDVQLYFDGAPAGHAKTTTLAKVTVHFVRLGSSADDAIKAHLERLGPAARNWTVVSSDREVQAAARSTHAGVIASEEFAGQVGRLRRSAEGSQGEREMSPDELQEWLRLFNARK